MTDYALIHERKEARRCGTPGVCIHQSTSISPRTSCRTSWRICIYMHYRRTAASGTYAERSTNRWPNLCMLPGKCCASGIRTCSTLRVHALMLHSKSTCIRPRAPCMVSSGHTHMSASLHYVQQMQMSPGINACCPGTICSSQMCRRMTILEMVHIPGLHRGSMHSSGHVVPVVEARNAFLHTEHSKCHTACWHFLFIWLPGDACIPGKPYALRMEARSALDGIQYAKRERIEARI